MHATTAERESHRAADAGSMVDSGRPCYTGREREQQELEAQREAEQQRRERRRKQWRWLARLPEPSSQPGETYAPNYSPSFAVDEASLAVDEASLKEHVPPPPPPGELDMHDAPEAPGAPDSPEDGESFDVRPGEVMLRNGPHYKPCFVACCQSMLHQPATPGFLDRSEAAPLKQRLIPRRLSLPPRLVVGLLARKLTNWQLR